LANLCGPLDGNLRQLEQRLDVRVVRRDHAFRIEGHRDGQRRAVAALERLQQMAAAPIASEEIELVVIEVIDADRRTTDATVSATPAATSDDGDPGASRADADPADDPENPQIRLRKALIQGRTANQREYLRNILGHDIAFGIGPAGTGKTYLAVACAAAAFENDEVVRIVLTRPAVEAGERLGFLPGDLAQKVDPYLRPLYDALYDLIGFDKVTKLFERQSIEIAPLAYMRGRTLNRSFIILDEAQNTTPEQMKMFLTRIGFGSKAVVTGDVTQIDLPRNQHSGLVLAARILADVRGIAFTRFGSQDVVRHPLVARIVDAYERHAAASSDHDGERGRERGLDGSASAAASNDNGNNDDRDRHN
jgi:phosphate starvation-inducible PhoH-like protein